MVSLGPTLAILLPLLTGLVPSAFFLKKISKNRVVSLGYGVLAFLILLIGSFIGLILSRYLNPEVYADLGDNPGMMRGWFYGLEISLPILLYVWFRYKFSSKKNEKMNA